MTVRRNAMTLDGEVVVLEGAPAEGEVIVLHALLDYGTHCPHDPALHVRAFERFFDGVARDCVDHDLTLGAYECTVKIGHKSIRSVAIAASGPRRWLDELVICWGAYIWRWGAIFARRARPNDLFVPLILPFDNNDLEFFPHVVPMPTGFDPDAFAATAVAAFTVIHRGVDMVACSDAGDAHSLRPMTTPL